MSNQGGLWRIFHDFYPIPDLSVGRNVDRWNTLLYIVRNLIFENLIPVVKMASIYDFKANDIKGSERSLGEFQGKVLLIVNTASKCGLTPQFEGLEALYEQYKGDGLEVLGFPCNQFAEQDKGSNEEIAGFCMKNYGVSFTMFEKIEVNGAGAHPLYQYLKNEAKGFLGTEKIKWNFTKFLVDSDGKVIKRFAPTTKPAAIEKYVQAALKK